METPKPLFAEGTKVYRTSGDVFEVETITRVVTNLSGQYWYYTTLANGQRRYTALAEREIRRA